MDPERGTKRVRLTGFVALRLRELALVGTLLHMRFCVTYRPVPFAQASTR